MSGQKFPPSVQTLRFLRQGKVRDTFLTNDKGRLLMVATDRISTHNIVHQSEIPLKGQVLTALTIFWCRFLEEIGVLTHLVAFGKDIYNYLPKDTLYPDDLHLRALVVRRLKMIPIEFIFRRYIAGSLWKGYSQGEPNPYGLELPPRMELMQDFGRFEFTPTDKSETDEPLNSQVVKEGNLDAYQTSLFILTAISNHLQSQRLTLVDTKLELAMDNGIVILADEIVTPDSSRIVDSDSIVIGENPPWLDKQLVRNEAERMWRQGREKAPLVFSEVVVDGTTQIYLEVFQKITGVSLEEFQTVNMS